MKQFLRTIFLCGILGGFSCLLMTGCATHEDAAAEVRAKQDFGNFKPDPSKIPPDVQRKMEESMKSPRQTQPADASTAKPK